MNQPPAKYTMSLSLLGAPSGTIIKGTQCYNKDLTIRLHSVVYPYVNDQDFLTYVKDQSNRADIVRQARRYRADLFNDDDDDLYILSWLSGNRVNGEGKGSEYLPDNTLIEVVASAGEKSKLPPSIVTGVMSVGDIQKALPKKTLSFYYYPWEIILEDYEVNPRNLIPINPYVIYEGDLIPMTDVKITPHIKAYRLNINREDIYLIGEQRDPTKSYVQELIDDQGLRATYDRLKRSTSYFTPAGYKSLLQKIIRVRPLYLELEDRTTLNATKALMSTFLMLYESGGSFVPDLQRFVSGKESAFKRLAVSIVEDGYFADIKRITSMLADALICQYDRSYNPTKIKLIECLEACCDVMLDHGYFSYKTSITPADSTYESIKEVDLDANKASLAAYLIGAIGSFKGDINMFRTLKIERHTNPEMKDSRINNYYLHRCIDHHWAPSIAYMFPHEMVRKMTLAVKTKDVLKPVLKYIWDYGSSFNPRRNGIASVENMALIGNIQLMYHLFNLGMYKTIPSSSTNHRIDTIGTQTIAYTLPESYLSVHVGMYSPDPNPHRVMACLDANNIYNVSTSKIPSRDIKPSDHTSILSPDIEIKTSKSMKSKLRKGGINGVRLTEDDTYTINGKPLSEWLYREVEVKLFDRSKDDDDLLLLATDMDNAAYDTDQPINTDAFTSDEINRAIYHILRSNTTLHMPTISKDGEGVTKSDVGAYWLLNQIASNYPYLLKQRRIGVFDVPHHTLLRRLLKSILGTNVTSAHSTKSKILPVDALNRKPYQHQIEALDEMKSNRNNFLWIPVGMGKTYIIITYIRHMMKIGKANKYVLYTMPTSAFAGVQTEFDHWSIKTNVISAKNTTLSRLCKKHSGTYTYTVNIINHDHLRTIPYELETYINDTLFIVDEVHKTLAETKRTDTALTLASLSPRFILLTGTPLINTKMVMLMNWLQLIVKYPINKTNFWIAISSMISKQVNTGVLVRKNNVYVPMKADKQLWKEFKKLVGPSLGGINSRVTEKDFREAINITYKRVHDELVNLAITHRDDGVFLIANNKEHQLELYNSIINHKRHGAIDPNDVGMMTKDNLYNLVNINDKGPKIIITTTRLSEGYTLTKLGVLITSVYFSNLATRQQLEGRINRITQTRKEVTHYIVYTDLLDLILKNYNHASSIANAMKLLAK